MSVVGKRFLEALPKQTQKKINCTFLFECGFNISYGVNWCQYFGICLGITH